MGGPKPDAWYTIAIADPDSDEMLGDLAVEPFYFGYGFEPTPRMVDHEVEARLRFDLDRP